MVKNRCRMKSSEGNSSKQRDLLKANDVLSALEQMHESEEDKALETLQILLDSCSRGISGDFSSWQSPLIHLLHQIINSNIRNQSALLSGRIFFSILSKIPNFQHLENHLNSFLALKTPNFLIFGENFVVKDRESLQLIIINSCLSSNKQKNLFSREIYLKMFEIIEKHCVLYTKHTYLAFRLLNSLLDSTKTTDYWQEDEKFEEKLEKIIMSNWDNCVNDAAKLNATSIFPKYLNIVSPKYPTFLEKSFDLLINQLSWHNPTKYTILTELFRAIKTPPLIEDHHILEIVESLAKSHLKHPSTKFYLAVWSDLEENDWLDFYELTHPIIKAWEEENNTSAIRFIWELWFRPTLKKFSKNIFFNLWRLLFRDEMIVSQSFLGKFAVSRGVELTSLLKSAKSAGFFGENVKNIWIKRGKGSGGSGGSGPFVLEDERECVRINGFFIYCSGAVFEDEEEFDDFRDNDDFLGTNGRLFDYKICGNFLFFNARAASNNMRKEIMDNFRVFIENIIKIDYNDDLNDDYDDNDDLVDADDGKAAFLDNLYEFIRNCFELGSCYQRRIMGLGLYEIILQSLKNLEIPKNKFEKFRKKIANTEISYDLMRLCLDPVEDVREKSCSLLCTYFPSKITAEDQKILFQEGMKYCRSSKFYEVSGGGKLLKLFIKTTDEDLSKCLYEEMKLQLSAMRRDILKATAQGSPFYGAIIALLETNFDKNSEKIQKSKETALLEINSDENFSKNSEKIQKSKEIDLLEINSAKNSEKIQKSKEIDLLEINSSKNSEKIANSKEMAPLDINFSKNSEKIPKLKEIALLETDSSKNFEKIQKSKETALLEFNSDKNASKNSEKIQKSKEIALLKINSSKNSEKIANSKEMALLGINSAKNSEKIQKLKEVAPLQMNSSENSSKNSTKIPNSTKITEEFATDLLNLLEEASAFFLSSLSPKTEETKYSPSFAEMGIAIEERITSSEMRTTITEENTCSLSPAHQTILSCIWMSLASICNLAAELTYISPEKPGNPQKRGIFRRSIDIVVKILMKCRHKGVIEVAGTVLVRLMKNPNINYTYFIKYLEDLLSLDAEDEINLTRRGAGQSIMFHRFIANDEKKNRPLLQTAMRKILTNLQNNSLKLGGKGGKRGKKCEEKCEKNSNRDDPLARQLHFLHRIVSDKSLHSHLVEYMEDIALTCLHHSTSPEWSIRNGSLQLLGAVIPRVVGQSSDGEIDFSSGYSIQHFLSHYPKLAGQILRYLREKADSEAIIMPILTLLSKMRVSGCEYIDYSSGDYRDEIKREIQILFEHPVAAVRNLAAKTFATLIPAYEICETIFLMVNSDFEGGNDNFRHSKASAVMYLRIRAKQEFLRGFWSFGDEERIQEGIKREIGRLNDLFRRWCENEDFRVNYIVETSFIKSILASNQLGKCEKFKFVINSEGHKAIRSKIRREGKFQGFWEFVDSLLEIHWFFTDFCGDSGHFLGVFDDIDRYSILMMKHGGKRIVKKDFSEKQEILEPLLKKICGIIDDSREFQEFQAYFPIIFGFIVKILENEESRTIRDSNLSFLITEIIEKLIKNENESDLLQRLGYSLAANHQINQFNHLNPEKFTKKAFDFISSSIKSGDEVVKLWALDCLKNSLKNAKFYDIADISKLKIIDSLVTLLNDQVPEIRSCIHEKLIDFQLSPFPHKFPFPQNSEIYLYQVLKNSVKNSRPLELNSRIEWLEALIASVINNNNNNNRNLEKDTNTDITSPFDHDELYREDGKMINVLTNFINSSNSSELINDALNISRINAIGNNYQENYIKKLMETHSHKLLAILNMKIGEYLLYKIEILKNIIRDEKIT